MFEIAKVAFHFSARVF